MHHSEHSSEDYLPFMDASRMVQSNPLNIPPDFMDLYISFLRSLVEEQPQGLKETYEFAAKYFERKIEERDTVGGLVARVSDSRPESLDSMPVPPNTLRVHTEYLLVKPVGPKVLWAESRVQGTEEYFPPIQLHA
ncbi:uncharacterized protein TNCV_2602131 [Trichonephila clavipes]|nr:uncharacterized protein TNCV_2602131 [Trichonephila clavipes]